MRTTRGRYPSSAKIEFVDQDVDHPNGIFLANPVFQALGKQRALPPIRPLNEASHPIPPQIAQESYRGNHIRKEVFTQPGSFATRVCHGLKSERSQEADTKPHGLTVGAMNGKPAHDHPRS